MGIERLSLRTLIIVSLVALSAVSVWHTLAAKRQFRDAAVNYRAAGISRLVEVAAQEVLRRAQMQALELAHAVQAEAASTWVELPDTPAADLARRLDDPFIRGFTGADRPELVKIRAYDTAFRLIAQSSLGLADLPPQLPAALATAHERNAAERAQTSGALWMTPQGPLYSVLVPVGGQPVRGHLEVVIDPVSSLRAVGPMIQMPLAIHAADGTVLERAQDVTAGDPAYYPAEYLLRYADGTPALRLVAYEDLRTLHDDMHAAQIRTTVTFLAAMAFGLGLLLWLLNRYLFRPAHTMIDQMEECIHGELETGMREHGIKEVRLTAHAFNVLMNRVRESLRDLQRLSALDSLTEIANRRHFDAMLQREWQRALRNDTSSALLLIDIDYFKPYNDNNGHQAGDQCLKAVARTIAEAIRRPGDLAARYGGEEFVVLLPETDTAGALRVAQRIKAAVAGLALPHPASEVSDRVTLSIGVCAAHAHIGMDGGILVAAADAALYRAKRLGRDRIELASWEDLAAGKAGWA